MRVLLVMVACCMVMQNAISQTLGEKIDSLIQITQCIRNSEVGVVVYDLNEGKEIYTYQSNKLFRPASVEKVITSVTALSVLGTDYSINTRLAYTGEIKNGILNGNLYVVGDFDPEFMESDLDRMVKAVADAGINRLNGQLIGDVSMMDSLYWGPGWSWDDTPEAFQPYYSPLMLNRGCVAVTVSPMAKGERGEVHVTPESDYYTVENHSVTMRPREGGLEITRGWLNNSNNIIVKGNVSRRSGRLVNMFDSKSMFMHTLRYKLIDKGVMKRGDSISWGVIPEELSGTMSGDSSAGKALEGNLHTVKRPLRQVLKRALKESDNLSAEALFFHAARRITGRTKDLNNSDGQDAIDRYMERNLDANPNNYEITDGCGVSIYNLVSPDLLMKYLLYAYSKPEIFPVFFDALPVAGIDGTLKYRMQKTSAYRRIHAKTGTLTGVSSLAGYAMRTDGRKYAFVIINQNLLKARPARAFQDKVCELLME